MSEAPPRTPRLARRIGTAIEFKHVHKWYGEFHVLRDINLTVGEGERIVICGPSGSGKSTLIRCINRLEEHQQGAINVDGIELTRDLPAIEKIRRRSAWCSSSSTCFPHLTVLQNLMLAPMWVRRHGEAEAEEPPCSISSACALRSRRTSIPAQLSGGQQQRVAIARALVHEPAHHAVRRADLRARPRDGQRGAGRDGESRAAGHDDARASRTRWGSRGGRGQRGLHGPGARSSSKAHRRSSSSVPRMSAQNASWPRSCNH